MKITGLELINKIYTNEIKEGTHINYYRVNYLGYEFYGELLFTNGAIWYTDNRPDCDMEVKTSVILDNHHKFEIIEEQKKIPEKLSGILEFSPDGNHISKVPNNEQLMFKINEIIDYLKSKGDE